MIEAAQKSSLQNEIQSKLTDHLMMNFHLKQMIQKGETALSRQQAVDDECIMSTTSCLQINLSQQSAAGQQTKNSLRAILKTVVYFSTIADLNAAREYLIARLQQLDYSEMIF